jgi:2-polyprenyl-3-methyl-5-hydroxy-6-metoxy-1,4-benzoquinol methylase
MFGAIYFNHPDVLRKSMRSMNEEMYRPAEPKRFVSALERLYLRLFGIPEVGLQVRALYFNKASKRLPPGMKTILDAGSGIGACAVTLARKYPEAEVIGCDIDREKVSFCEGLVNELGLRNLSFVSADITNLDRFHEPFDAIVSIDVLEHVVDYESALRGFHRMLKPNGWLYIHTPQPIQIRILKRFCSWHHQDHVREGFTPAALVAELSEVGFTAVDVRQTFGGFGRFAWELNHLTLAWRIWLGAAAFPLLYLVARLDPLMRNRTGLGVSVLAEKS